jgi:RNA polymerase sigma-70 factor (ECF subfamily)
VTQTALEDLRLARAAQKDRRAAEQVVERLGPRVRHTVWLLVGADDEAEDLINSCLLAILENLRNFKGTGSLEAWSGQLTYRVLMRLLKRRRRSERTVTLVDEDGGVSRSNPEQETASRGALDGVTRLLDKLPAKRRETLVLRLLYGYSVAEVAALTDAPINTVRDRIRVGLKELRNGIARDRATRELLGRKRRG